MTMPFVLLCVEWDKVIMNTSDWDSSAVSETSLLFFTDTESPSSSDSFTFHNLTEQSQEPEHT